MFTLCCGYEWKQRYCQFFDSTQNQYYCKRQTKQNSHWIRKWKQTRRNSIDFDWNVAETNQITRYYKASKIKLKKKKWEERFGIEKKMWMNCESNCSNFFSSLVFFLFFFLVLRIQNCLEHEVIFVSFGCSNVYIEWPTRKQVKIEIVSKAKLKKMTPKKHDLWGDWEKLFAVGFTWLGSICSTATIVWPTINERNQQFQIENKVTSFFHLQRWRL